MLKDVTAAMWLLQIWSLPNAGMVNFRQVQSRLANNPVLREREGCLSACFKSVQSARGLMHWRLTNTPPWHTEETERARANGDRNRTVSTYTETDARAVWRMLHDNYLRAHASRRCQTTRAAFYIKMAMDPWPDLAHFACLLGSTVHILCLIHYDTAQSHAAFYILSICMLHDTFCVLHDTFCVL